MLDLIYRCYSFVGRRTGGQTVSLDRDGCISLNIVQHELLHTLGFHHEHNRSDRDNHVQIIFKNIIPGTSDWYTFLQQVLLYTVVADLFN